MQAKVPETKSDFYYVVSTFGAAVVGGAVVALALWVALPVAGSADPETANQLAVELGLLDESIQAIQRDVSALAELGRLPNTPTTSGAAPPERIVSAATHEDVAAVLMELARIAEAVAPHDISEASAGVKREELRGYAESETPIPTKSWRLWTPQQLLREYGPPDIVDSDGVGLRWSYAWPDGTQVTFTILEGLAVELVAFTPNKGHR